MENMFRKESAKFDGTNYYSWKDNMKTHLLCISRRYWLVTKVLKKIVEEDDPERCTEEQREVFL